MKRFWVGFEESWIKAILVDTPDSVTLEDVKNKISNCGTISFAKEEEDITSKLWQYTNTVHRSWIEF